MKTVLKTIFDELYAKAVVRTQLEFGNRLEYDSGYISRMMKSVDPLPSKLKKKLSDVFQISKVYLDSDGIEGSVFLQESTRRRVPLIGDGAAGGDMQINVQDANYIDDYIDVGDLLKDSEAAFTVYGNSMAPAYASGVILGIRQCFDNFIQPGELYLLVTKSNRIFKRLYYTDDKTAFTCYSDNTMAHETGPLKGKYYYPPFEVPLTEVLHIYDITGMIKRTRNSGIINRQK